MRSLPDNLFGLAQMRSLVAEEWSIVREQAARVASGPVVSLSPVDFGAEALPGGHTGLVRLHMESGRWAGDLRCAEDSLPLCNDSAQVLVVRHVFEFLDAESGLETELARILAPSGLLLVFGLNPLSPWRLWCSRQSRPGMRMPRCQGASRMRRLLARQQLHPYAEDYIGGAWPSLRAGHRLKAPPRHGAPWHGAWLLLARKQRLAGRLVGLHRQPLRGPLYRGLAQLPSRRAAR